ncbi:hypothetical protein F4811DRAFT_215541 [Daldinia bambusicola]|nr:hypothetical protein F4811DRAFT_215541 [Daldinia bambusicola]
MSLSSWSSTSCLSVMATRRRCDSVRTCSSSSSLPPPPPPAPVPAPVPVPVPVPVPTNSLNASSTSSAAGPPRPRAACSFSAQIATNGSYAAYPSSSGSRISRNSASSDLLFGARPRALLGRDATMARRTSLVGMTPSFSPSAGSANSPNASLISRSSRAEMLCSFASFDCLSFGALVSAAVAVVFAALRLGGYIRPCFRVLGEVESKSIW